MLDCFPFGVKRQPELPLCVERCDPLTNSTPFCCLFTVIIFQGVSKIVFKDPYITFLKAQYVSIVTWTRHVKLSNKHCSLVRTVL